MAIPTITRATWKQDAVALLAHPFTFVAVWLLGGTLSILVPLTVWNKENKKYYLYYGQYQDQDDNNQDDGNNNNNNNQYNYYQTCRWWQWGCKANQYYYNNGDNNNNDNQVPLPTWWIATFGNDSEEERREREESGEASGALKFVYVWSLLLFLGILAYGVWVVVQRRGGGPGGLLASLFVFTNYAVLSMLLLAQGVINGEGRELEVSGFYGQFSVLMFMTYFWYALFGAIAALIFGVRHWALERQSNKGHDGDNDEREENAYQSYSAPEVKVGSAQQIV